MISAFGVEHGEISKKIQWTGEPGDKRNTKYALAGAAGAPVPVAGSIGTMIGYGIYRQSDKSKKERAASIKRAKARREKEKK